MSSGAEAERTKAIKAQWRAEGKENVNVWTGRGVARYIKRMARLSFLGMRWDEVVMTQVSPEIVRRILEESGLPAEIEALKLRVADAESKAPVVKPKPGNHPTKLSPPAPPPSQSDGYWAPIEVDPADERLANIAINVGCFAIWFSVPSMVGLLLVAIANRLA